MRPMLHSQPTYMPWAPRTSTTAKGMKKPLPSAIVNTFR